MKARSIVGLGASCAVALTLVTLAGGAVAAPQPHGSPLAVEAQSSAPKARINHR